MVAGVALGSARPRARPLVPSRASPTSLVWAGDADRQNADFLAVIDADPTSPIVRQGAEDVPRTLARQRAARRERRLARRSARSSRAASSPTAIFVFDLATAARRAPRARRRAGSPGRRLWAPHEIRDASPTGAWSSRAATRPAIAASRASCSASPGGLARTLAATATLVREVPARDPGGARHDRRARTGAAVVGPARSAGHHEQRARLHRRRRSGERMPGISVQVWRLSDLKLAAHRRARRRPARRGEPRAARRRACCAGRAVRAGQHRRRAGRCTRRTRSARRSRPSAWSFDFGAGALPGGAAITPDDRWYVTALGGKNRVVALDLPIRGSRRRRPPCASTATRSPPAARAPVGRTRSR